MSRRSGWPWFFAWALPGLCLGLQISVIGIVLLPIAVIAIVVLQRRARAWPEALGLLVGIGLLLLVLGALNADYRPCTDGPVTLGPGDDEYSCGGLDPIPFLLAGTVATTLTMFGYWWLSQRHSRPTREAAQ